MSVQGYTGNFYVATVGIDGLPAAAQPFSGLADVQIQWRRTATLWKPLDYSAPVLVQGKSQGRINVAGLATVATDTQMTPVIDAFTGGTVTPTRVTLNLYHRKNMNPATTATTATYTGYSTGQGFRFRQIADRTWAMDGVAVISLVD